METTRRDFLKGLLATGAALAVAPHLLVEPVHGASDLTPQERDVAAEVMGLRQGQWQGWVKPMSAHWFDAQRYLQGAPEQATIHVKFTEEEVVWKRRSIIVPVPEPTLWPDGCLRFGQMEVPLLDSGEPDWDYATRAMRELAEQAGDRVVAARWVEEDRGLYEYGT